MGFKKENYTPKGICWCIYFFLLTNIYSAAGQSHCPIRVEYEPREISQIRSANNIKELKFPFYQMWENLDQLRLSDDSWASVSLPNNKRSTVFKGQNLGFAIPNGAQIAGIEIFVEGHTTGEGKVEGQMLKLLDSSGKAVGSNKANNALPIDEDYLESNDSTDFIWRYGSSTDIWGLSFTEEKINDSNFGFALQIRNKLNKPVSVFLDNIYMVVYYTPLYEICSTHACVPFYIDESDDELVTYEWYIPEGFEMISDSEEDPAINIGVSYAEFGEYEICVESFYKQSSLGICCRKFNYSNCEPAYLGGNLFLDNNNDSSNNNGDQGLGDILINLYTNKGIFVKSTFSDQNGNYAFSDLLNGQYYIEVVDNIDSLVFTTPNIGNEDIDSDITDAYGAGTSELINLTSGDSITNIGAGFNLALTLGDFVWEDINGDGIQQEGEPGIEGVEINITSPIAGTFSTFSDNDGIYSFTGLTAGEYTINFIAPSEWIPTIANNSDDDTDSDFENSPLTLSFSTGGEINNIDAGFYRLSSIGDFVWDDFNNNGIQDEAEPGIVGATLNLINTNDEVIQTTSSDSSGFYLFKSLSPGDYQIEVVSDSKYTPTLFQFDGGLSNEEDSDLIEQDEKLLSPSITITSNTTNSSIDFGLVEKPATLGGFTFLDENNSGQYETDEGFVANVDVWLYNSNDEKIDSTQSDQGGYYFFEEISAGDYYLVFQLPENLLFTIADQGDDLSDSDVTNEIIFGSTGIYTLLPEEENYSVSAGYQSKPKVGDYVWLDTNGNGIQDEDESGINDVTVELYNAQNELVQSMNTMQHPENETAGYYLFQSLEPGNYYIKIPENELYNFAIVDALAVGSNSTITNENGIGTSATFELIGNQCNLDIDAGYAFKKGNISGEVWIDQNEDGIQDSDDILKSEVFISLYDENGTLLFTRTTNENGQYIFSGLDPGNYYLVFAPIDRYRFTNALVGTDNSLDSDITNGISTGSTSIITVIDGTTIEHIDAGLIDGVISVSGMSWIDNNGDGIQQIEENPLPNVSVELFNLNDSLLATTITNQEGQYSFDNNLSEQYYIVFSPENESYINTDSNQGSDDDIDDDVTSFFTIGSTDTLDLIYFQDVTSINAGYYTLSTIGDQVFIDNNENGINDNEPGLNGVIVNLIDELEEIIASDTTAQGGGLDSGYYLIENIPPGVYTVQFIRPLFYQFVTADQGGDDNTDSDVVEITNNTGTTAEITVNSGTQNSSIDAGVFYQIPTESSISGIIWNDTNLNGLRDGDELTTPSISIELENQDGDNIGSTMSGVDGSYTFENLAEGFYTVKAVIPSDKVATYPNVGSDETIDSDFIENAGEVKTNNFFLATFEDIANIDLGIMNKLEIGDFAWEDSNNNGRQDADELGIEEIEITLTSQNGLISETTMSGANGEYKFENLPAGFYKICVELPSGFNFALSNIGADILDSDVDSLGCTEFLDYSSGGIVQDLDIGFTKNGSIDGIAFIDLNGNGINNLNDSGLDGVPVTLYNLEGGIVESTVTSTIDEIPGKFKFNNLKATAYYLVFDYPDEYIITNPNIGDDLTDSDITGLFGEGSTDLFTVPSGGQVNNIAGGAYLPASIGDQVWLDENKNGIRDEGEEGVAGIDVIIFRSFGVPIDTVKTDLNGIYQFENLKQGLYFIQFVIPQEYSISPSDQGIDDEIDSDADNTGKTPLISLAHGADLESVDCGIFSSMASLRSVVWNDSNGDGIRQNQEARIPGIKISLLDPQDNIIKSAISNTLGLYAFEGIPEGDYKIYVDITETDYAFTSANMDDNDFVDSDIMNTGESEMFESFETSAQLSVPNVDAGLQEGGMIISSIWEDENADGIFNSLEKTMKGIEVILKSIDGQIHNEIVSTDDFENINFNNVRPGKYYLKYQVKDGYVNSSRNGEIQEDYNSDVSNFEGQFISSVFEIKSKDVITHIDAGFYLGATVTTKVWFDKNGNGLQDDVTTTPLGIYATLYNEEDKPCGTRGIGQNGEISFKGINKGQYYLKYYASTPLSFTKNIDDKESNSDVDHSNGIGTTRSFEFNPYSDYTHVDAGLIQQKVWAQKSVGLKQSQIENETRESNETDTNEVTFEIRPNPVVNYVNIEIGGQINGGEILIHNSNNQLVYSGMAKSDERIDMTSLHPGIYFVTLKSGENKIVKKLIKIQ